VTAPATDIVIRSHARDFVWLRYCLAAVDRWCRGFRRVIVVVPRRSAPRLARVRFPCDDVVLCDDVAEDYLGQQVTKLHADELTDAELIAHLDSDCILRRPLTPADLADPAGRPRIAMTPNACFAGRGPWQEATERLLGAPVAYDYMRRQPLMFPRWLYPALRDDAKRRHGVSLRDYVLASAPLDVSEFNALGAFAHRHHADAFAWERWPSTAYDERFALICWSWGGVDAALGSALDAVSGAGAPADA
jgi:hypothetical protein